MLTKIFNKIRGSRTVTNVTNVTNLSTPTPSGILYAVTLPGQEPVMLRAANQVEVKAFVRDAHGLKRLPAGTTVERVS